MERGSRWVAWIDDDDEDGGVLAVDGKILLHLSKEAAEATVSALGLERAEIDREPLGLGVLQRAEDALKADRAEVVDVFLQLTCILDDLSVARPMEEEERLTDQLFDEEASVEAEALERCAASLLELLQARCVEDEPRTTPVSVLLFEDDEEEEGPLVADIEGFPDFSPDDDVEPVDPKVVRAQGTLRVCFGLRAVVACEHCRVSMPVLSISSVHYCHQCAEPQARDEAWWAGLFEESSLVVALRRAVGIGGETTAMDGSFRYRYRRFPPHCSACKQALGDDFIEAATKAPEGSSAPCPSCSAAIAIRRGEALENKIAPGAVAVIGEGPRALGDGAQAPDGTEPIAFSCQQCGGTLEADGRVRTLRCRYCETSNYLPDALWFRLHPQPKLREFYLVVDLDEKVRWRWLLQDDDHAADALRAAKALPKTAVKRALKHSEEAVRAALARSAHLSSKAALKLAKDDETEVRVALARNRKAPEEALVVLGSDSDEEVLEALCKRRRAPIEALSVAARQGPPKIQALIASSDRLEQLPEEALLKLASSLSKEVHQALRSNTKLIGSRLLPLLENGPLEGRTTLALLLEADRPEFLKLAEDEHAQVLCALAKNPATPAAVIRTLSLSKDESVVSAAREHPRYTKPSLWERAKASLGR